MYVCMYVCMYVYEYIFSVHRQCIYANKTLAYVCMHVCMYVYVYLCTFVYVCMYAYSLAVTLFQNPVHLNESAVQYSTYCFPAGYLLSLSRILTIFRCLICVCMYGTWKATSWFRRPWGCVWLGCFAVTKSPSIFSYWEWSGCYALPARYTYIHLHT